jgi:hypothetical protein
LFESRRWPRCVYGSPSGAFVFQIGCTLTTGSGATVDVLNGDPDSRIFWQVGSSATLGTGTVFAGNILAVQSITLNTGASILCGRAIALVGAGSMDSNTVSNDCEQLGLVNGSGDFGSLGFSGGLDGDEPSPVPVPATGLLLLAALGGFGLLRTVRRDTPTAVTG